jgi:hypothetical protein
VSSVLKMEASDFSEILKPEEGSRRFIRSVWSQWWNKQVFQKCWYLSTTVHGFISQRTILWKSPCHSQTAVTFIADTEVRTKIHYAELYSNCNF